MSEYRVDTLVNCENTVVIYKPFNGENYSEFLCSVDKLIENGLEIPFEALDILWSFRQNKDVIAILISAMKHNTELSYTMINEGIINITSFLNGFHDESAFETDDGLYLSALVRNKIVCEQLVIFGLLDILASHMPTNSKIIWKVIRIVSENITDKCVGLRLSSFCTQTLSVDIDGDCLYQILRSCCSFVSILDEETLTELERSCLNRICSSQTLRWFMRLLRCGINIHKIIEKDVAANCLILAARNIDDYTRSDFFQTVACILLHDPSSLDFMREMDIFSKIRVAFQSATTTEKISAARILTILFNERQEIDLSLMEDLQELLSYEVVDSELMKIQISH